MLSMQSGETEFDFQERKNKNVLSTRKGRKEYEQRVEAAKASEFENGNESIRAKYPFYLRLKSMEVDVQIRFQILLVLVLVK